MKILDKSGLEYYTSKVKGTLTDYVKFTDYASENKSGVVKVNSTYNLSIDNGSIYPAGLNITEYNNANNRTFIGKYTLENVITGKGLVSNTDYASGNNAGVIKLGNGISLDGQNKTLAQYDSYETYLTRGNYFFISKGTLENVLTAKIGDIQTLLDNLDTGNGV